MTRSVLVYTSEAPQETFWFGFIGWRKHEVVTTEFSKPEWVKMIQNPFLLHGKRNIYPKHRFLSQDSLYRYNGHFIFLINSELCILKPSLRSNAFAQLQ